MTSPAPGSACACGSPSREQLLPSVPAVRTGSAGRAGAAHPIAQAVIPAGSFAMGDSAGGGNPADGETPVHDVSLRSFLMDATPVTNSAFAAFVDATGYQTEAEIYGFSAVFHLALAASPEDIVGRPAQTPWWLGVKGADWAHPGGRRSDVAGLGDHPVVHVSWNDAIAYCEWAGRRLPSEAEWEYASRGGLDRAAYPWGDEPIHSGGWRANIFQGLFPHRNTAEDGFATTAPVRSFAPNGYGLWQTVGNVWEWCSDWFDPTYYGRSERTSPGGPGVGQTRVLRGGSYLCHDSYCNRYRNAARSRNTPDSSMGNTGFRTAAAL